MKNFETFFDQFLVEVTHENVKSNRNLEIGLGPKRRKKNQSFHVTLSEEEKKVIPSPSPTY